MEWLCDFGLLIAKPQTLNPKTLNPKLCGAMRFVAQGLGVKCLGVMSSAIQREWGRIIEDLGADASELAGGEAFSHNCLFPNFPLLSVRMPCRDYPQALCQYQSDSPTHRTVVIRPEHVMIKVRLQRPPEQSGRCMPCLAAELLLPVSSQSATS